MISTTDYSNIICLLEVADARQLDANAELTKMQINLSATNSSGAKTTALADEIGQSGSNITSQRQAPLDSVVAAVKALHAHVTKYYGAVDLFLSNNSIRVSPYIANVSAIAGYTIASANIGSTCIR